MNDLDVLIIGNKYDRCAVNVKQLLEKENIKVAQLSTFDLFSEFNFFSNSFQEGIGCKVGWYRSDCDFRKLLSKKVTTLNDLNTFSLFQRYVDDIAIFRNNFYRKDSFIKNKYWLNEFKNTRTDKIFQLKSAVACGLDTPNSIYTNSRKELELFSNKYGEVITKPISNILIFNYPDRGVVYNQRVRKVKLSAIKSSYFFPSFFQEYLEKKIEIRSLVIGGKYFSVAINNSEYVDVRESISSSRTYEIDLPQNLKKKLSKFCRMVQCDMGVFDLVVDSRGIYNFIEFNPSGKVDLIAQRVNEDIYNHICEFLLNKLYA